MPSSFHLHRMFFKFLNYIVLSTMLGFLLLILFISQFLQFPNGTPLIQSLPNPTIAFQTTLNPNLNPDPFTNLLDAFQSWDSQVGCAQFRQIHKSSLNSTGVASLQEVDGSGSCGGMKMNHVSVLVKKWTWIPDNLDNLYSCRCGLTCLWTKSSVLADKPDVLLFENSTPPSQRRIGDPLRAYMDLEVERRRSGHEDIFIGYHVEDDIQSTYAGSFFHNNRSYHLSSQKNNETLVYWSSSRCRAHRNQLANKLLTQIPHHSFGKCLNNVQGPDMALVMYPQCINDVEATPIWYDHLHCAMSHYKFVLAIENTVADSYVTEKLFYALDAGAVPIYFGAPNVHEFVPPHSIIDGTKFSTMDELATYVKALGNDPVAYSEYHAWRRCGVFGNYGRTRAVSLDTLPCRLCEIASKKGGRNA